MQLQFPVEFPFDTMLVQQFLTVVKERFPQDLEAVTRRFYEHIWRDGNSLKTVDDIVSFAATFFPKDKLEKLGDFAEKDIRRRLGQQGEKLAAEVGIFGTPWIVATRSDGKSISTCVSADSFGVDHIEHLAAFFHKPYLGPFANGLTPKL